MNQSIFNSQNLPSALQSQISEMWKVKGSTYKPRTRHFIKNGSPKYTNRLFLETSPYLLQHAHNPVNWFPWGEEAFAAAKKLNRPVFLSIGYSTCHWCHVMEEESFEDEEIAQYLNENYIAIKVDREERPDIDAIYMSAVQALTGQGGWPLSAWLTPEQKPFYGGTYFPPRDGDRGSRNGFLTILKYLKNAYVQNPEEITDAAKQITEAVNQRLNKQSSGDLATTIPWQRAITYFQNQFDKHNGGTKGAPKFPSNMPVRLLFRDYLHTKDKHILNIATLTLQKMSRGGIYDHIAGGFHRYSTDEHWLVPHFEKMLYDNALLAVAYLEAYQVTQDKDFARVTEEVLDYVIRDMTSADGAFYSATDADSIGPAGHREEGYFFTWTPDEIAKVLDPKSALIFQDYYDISTAGNWENRSILNIKDGAATVASKHKLSLAEFKLLISSSREKLYQARNNRSLPIRDEKILTAWNSLMISAFSKAGFVLNKQIYIDKAVEAAQFILANLIFENKLYRSFKDKKKGSLAFLDDYAFFIAALLDLYEATFDLKWLENAIKLDKILAAEYEDKINGGFFMTSQHHEKLITREKPSYDGAEPSGNSAAILNLLRLNAFTSDEKYYERAVRGLQYFAGILQSNPISLTEMLLAVDFYMNKTKEIAVIKGKTDDLDMFLQELRRQFTPNKVLTVVTEEKQQNKLTEIIPWLQDKTAQNSKTTAYVCEKGTCHLPTTDPAIFSQQLTKN